RRRRLPGRASGARRPPGARGGAGADARPAGAPPRSGSGAGSVSGLPIVWYIARGFGLAAFALLTLGVWLGLAMSTRLLGGRRQWRRLHYASFAAFGLALAHAVTTGTDLAGVGGPILVILAGGPVLWLTLARILLGRRSGRTTAEAALGRPEIVSMRS